MFRVARHVGNTEGKIHKAITTDQRQKKAMKNAERTTGKKGRKGRASCAIGAYFGLIKFKDFEILI